MARIRLIGVGSGCAITAYLINRKNTQSQTNRSKLEVHGLNWGFHKLMRNVLANSPKGLTLPSTNDEPHEIETEELEAFGFSSLGQNGQVQSESAGTVSTRGQVEQFNPKHHIFYPYETHPLWAQLNHFGYPSRDTNTLKICGNFVLQYCKEKKVPRWTYEHITREMVAQSKGKHWPKKTSLYFSDPTIEDEHRVSRADFIHRKKYNSKEYTLGHMAAAMNHRLTYEWHKMTYIMTNMAPQVKGLNSGFWIKVEHFAQELLKAYSSLYVFTGTIVMEDKPSSPALFTEEVTKWIKMFQDVGYQLTYSKSSTNSQIDSSMIVDIPKLVADLHEKSLVSFQTQPRKAGFELIGKSHKSITVPASFFKIYVCQTIDGGEYDLWVFHVPNESIPYTVDLETYQSDIPTVSRLAGLSFFKKQLAQTITFRNCNGQPCPEPSSRYRQRQQSDRQRRRADNISPDNNNLPAPDNSHDSRSLPDNSDPDGKEQVTLNPSHIEIINDTSTEIENIQDPNTSENERLGSQNGDTEEQTEEALADNATL